MGFEARRRSAFIAVCLVIITLSFLPALAQLQPTTRPEAWRQDLKVLATDLPLKHANLFFAVSQQDFNKAVANLDQEIPSLSDPEIIVRLAAVVASVRDAHTNLSLRYNPTGFHRYPIKVQWFTDGLFVTGAGIEYRKALGCKLVGIGQSSIDEAFEAVRPVISHENLAWAKDLSRDYLLLAEVLYALRILPGIESGDFVFEDRTGVRFTLGLKPLATAAWINWPDPEQVPTLLSNKDPNLNYWFQYLGDARTLYIKYNACTNVWNLPFREFSDRVLAFFDANPVDSVVIDVRHNGGGDSEVIAPLRTGLQQRVSEGRLHRNRLFTVTGPGTFSSGVLNAIQLDKLGGTLIGEPTGGKPNCYGQVVGLTLPNSQLTVHYSTGYFELLPGTDTPSLNPDVLVEAASADSAQGRDPVLEQILQERRDSTSTAPFVLHRGGGLSLHTSSFDTTVGVGSARLVPAQGSYSASGIAIFSYRPGGVTITEASVPAVSLVQTARLFADAVGNCRTGLAMANPSDSEVSVSFHFTDSDGANFGAGTITIPANAQIARFLDEEPFRLVASAQTTFAFQASAPIAVLGLRGRTNERGEFLITTLPLSAPTEVVGQTLIIPQFADGDTASTQVMLVNPTTQTLSGTLEFYDQGTGENAGKPVNVVLDGKSGSNFAYQLPPGGTRTFSTSGTGTSMIVGSARIVPAAGNPPPQAMAVFSLRHNGNVVTEAGVPAVRPSTSARLYVDLSGDVKNGGPGSIETGIAVANASNSSIMVDLKLLDRSGSPVRSGWIMLPPRGQVARFIHEIEELGSLTSPFQGILEVSAYSDSLAITGLRGRYNERGEFLVTSTPTFSQELSNAVQLFPHIADGAGFRTQLILLDWQARAGGTVHFKDQSGAPWSVRLR